MATFRKIGVLTSGGDAPGMNACAKAVVNKALAMGIEVVGINRGYAGLMQGDVFDLTQNRVHNVVSLGGTFLYSSRCLEFMTEQGIRIAVNSCRKHGIDALICIGGDGTFLGATAMTNHGIPSIGLPGTIDNDITATDNTIGFDTAINTTVQMIDNLRDTCESHARLNVVEVMGRDCGLLALRAAMASGAVAVAVPEIPFDEEEAFEKIRKLRRDGKRSMIVVVSEGVFTPDGKPYSEVLAKRIQEKTGVETKFTRFGHVVRGGNPTAEDRILASRVACRAIEQLVAGRSNVVMCEINGVVEPVDINFALLTDMMYKKRLKPGDLDDVSEEDQAKMRAICEQRTEELQRLYRTACDVSF
jgi:6-phosphofructokinase 1